MTYDNWSDSICQITNAKSIKALSWSQIQTPVKVQTLKQFHHLAHMKFKTELAINNSIINKIISSQTVLKLKNLIKSNNCVQTLQIRHGRQHAGPVHIYLRTSAFQFLWQS